MEPLAAPTAAILLVGDQRRDLLELEAILGPLGHDLVTARSGEEALREILRRDLALILLDTGMPGISESGIVERIWQHPRSRDIPIVFLTAGHDAGGVSAAAPWLAGSPPGPVDVLARPFSPEVVRARVSVFVDLHARGKKIRAQERMLRRREREVHRANIVRDEFLSVASHELRTPLTSLKLEVANLLRLARRGDLEADGRLPSRVERIDAQVARLHRLIDELLDVSRIAAGSLGLELEEVDLAEVANEVVQRFGDEAARLGSTLEARAPVRTMGYWDRNRLDQVITNLVSNALKYGEGKPIEVTVEARGERAVLVVRDQGVGIAPTDQKRIFGRFERAASSRNYGGMGLGLSIVKQLVDAFGGSVTVDSRPGLGAEFIVQLPRTKVSTSPARLNVSDVEPEAFRKAIARAVRS